MLPAGPTSCPGIAIYMAEPYSLWRHSCCVDAPSCWLLAPLWYLWSIGPSVFSVPGLSPSPGCDHRLHEDCGLSVSVDQAEYCLNRNSCAALYPDVANRVCARVCVSVFVLEVDEGVCVRVLDWLGRVVELSQSLLRHGADYYLPFLVYSQGAKCVCLCCCLFCFFYFIWQKKIMNMQKIHL